MILKSLKSSYGNSHLRENNSINTTKEHSDEPAIAIHGCQSNLQSNLTSKSDFPRKT